MYSFIVRTPQRILSPVIVLEDVLLGRGRNDVGGRNGDDVGLLNALVVNDEVRVANFDDRGSVENNVNLTGRDDVISNSGRRELNAIVAQAVEVSDNNVSVVVDVFQQPNGFVPIGTVERSAVSVNDVQSPVAGPSHANSARLIGNGNSVEDPFVRFESIDFCSFLNDDVSVLDNDQLRVRADEYVTQARALYAEVAAETSRVHRENEQFVVEERRRVAQLLASHIRATKERVVAELVSSRGSRAK